MKRPQAIAAAVLGSVLVLFACQVDSPTAPDIDDPEFGKGHGRHGHRGKIQICHVDKRKWYHHYKWSRHRDKGKTYEEIWIKERHENWHRSHGDGQVGDEVPGKDGYVFGERCRPERSKGAITVVKVADASGVFDFEGSYGVGTFQLSTGDSENSSVTFDDLKTRKEYSIFELPHAEFTLTSASCVLESGEATGTADGLGVADIEVEPGKTTTCTFVNTSVTAPETGSLRVVKTSDAPGSFEFIGSALIEAFTLNTSDPATSEVVFDDLVVGAYSVSELPAAGFTLSSASCTLEGGGATGTFDGSGVNDLAIETGQTTTCVFDNAAVQATGGSLNIVKTSNVAGTFNFVGGAGIGSFTLNTADQATSARRFDGLGTEGTHEVAEVLGSDFMLVSATCNLQDGTPTGTLSGTGVTGIVVQEGQVTNCSFVNVAVPANGTLRVIKMADVGGAFAFDGSPSIGPFTVNVTESADGEISFEDLDPNVSYTINETVPSGFTLESAICQLEDGTETGTASGSGVSGVEIESGSVTTCTFVNAAVPTFGTLLVVMSTDAPGVFQMSGEPGIGSFTLDTSLPATSQQSFELTDVTSTYSIAQALNSLFEFTGAQCLLGDGTETGTLTDSTVSGIIVEPGSTTTCTFNNVAPPVGPPYRGQ